MGHAHRDSLLLRNLRALNDWILSGRRCSGPTKSFSANDKDDSFVSDTKKSSEIPLKRLLSSSQYVMLEGRRGSVPVKSEDTKDPNSEYVYSELMAEWIYFSIAIQLTQHQVFHIWKICKDVLRKGTRQITASWKDIAFD
mmetsp:Transcript_33815/g.81994  ORF Transcript_33815/g.81994 Transcript_33815/m.81994 type:complete len:140 (+) Transcript_33815:295-714(+)